MTTADRLLEAMRSRSRARSAGLPPRLAGVSTVLVYLPRHDRAVFYHPHGDRHHGVEVYRHGFAAVDFLYGTRGGVPSGEEAALERALQVLEASAPGEGRITDAA